MLEVVRKTNTAFTREQRDFALRFADLLETRTATITGSDA